MRNTIPHQKLGLFACGIIVVSNIKKPVETCRRRLERGNRQYDQYNGELSHKRCQGFYRLTSLVTAR